MLKTAKVGGATVLANSSGRTLYWFAPDTSAKSACNGACAQTWPPVPGSSHEQTHVSGHVNTIKRSDGATQVTFNGHPLYTYTADSGPGQANGNGINAFGGVWHDVTVSGSGSGSTGSTPSSGGGGGGY